MTLFSSIVIYLVYWGFLILVARIIQGTWRIGGYAFSARNYYLWVFAFVLPTLVESLIQKSWIPLMTFMLFGVAGVIGEMIASIWWRLFFSKRFWEYKVQTVFHRYTSWLNFIPWAIGGMIYMSILQLLSIDPNAYAYAHLGEVFGTAMIVGIASQYIFGSLFRHGKRFTSVTFLNALFFFYPIALAIAILSILYGPELLIVAAAFAVAATFAEYLFGKITEYAISKKLWIYVYVSVDKGHFTPLSVPLFAAAGFYFWSVARLLHGL